MNYYAELIKCKEVISSQQEIIQKLENKMSDKLLTIDYLTRQLYEREKPALSVNLLILNNRFLLTVNLVKTPACRNRTDDLWMTTKTTFTVQRSSI